MFSYIWPIGLVVLSNIVYHISAKSLPGDVNPFASLTITYLIGTICSAVFFFALGHGQSFGKEILKMNWAPFVMGLVVVGLEVGFLYAYKVGWQVSTAAIVQSSFLAIALLLVGFIGFHESLTWKKVVGVLICMVGLVFINMK